MLAYYASQFNLVEVNSSFYAMPKRESLLAWKAQLPKDFQIFFQMPQGHQPPKKAKGVGRELEEFLKVVTCMQEKLGAILVQLHPFFKINLGVLDEFLRLFPREIPFSIEFRNPSWFVQETYDSLGNFKTCLCLADSEKLAG